jgi:hypothetical protein
MSDVWSSLRLEPAVFRLLKLLTSLREITLRSEDTLALIRRLATDRCRPEDYEVLIRVVRAHPKLSADDLDAFGALDGPSPARQTPSQGPRAKKVHRRHRRSSGRGIDPRGDAGSFPIATPHGKKDSTRDHGRRQAR